MDDGVHVCGAQDRARAEALVGQLRATSMTAIVGRQPQYGADAERDWRSSKKLKTEVMVVC